jgi:hypothetical protein
MPIKSICSGEICEAGFKSFRITIILLVFTCGLRLKVGVPIMFFTSTISPISIDSGAIGSPTTLLPSAPSLGATLLGLLVLGLLHSPLAR